jgi:hypothetical protein
LVESKITHRIIDGLNGFCIKGPGPGKEAVMQANTGARRNVFDGFNIDWNRLHSRTHKLLSKEGLAEIALFASTAGVLGYVIWWAAKAAESYTILGLG